MTIDTIGNKSASIAKEKEATERKKTAAKEKAARTKILKELGFDGLVSQAAAFLQQRKDRLTVPTDVINLTKHNKQNVRSSHD